MKKVYRHVRIGHEVRVMLFMAMMALMVAPVQSGVAIVVAADSQIGNLSQSQVKNVFLGKLVVLPDGSTVTPIYQQSETAVFSEFNDTVLAKTESQITQYWARRVFAGKGSPPNSLADDKAVKAFVISLTGGVGYISVDAVDSTVKVVFRQE